MIYNSLEASSSEYLEILDLQHNYLLTYYNKGEEVTFSLDKDLDYTTPPHIVINRFLMTWDIDILHNLFKSETTY